jgi:hypothetical protein
MTTTDAGSESDSNVIEPTRALAKKYVEPILYLADRMSAADKTIVVKERSIIEDMAEATNKKNFRSERGFADLTEDKACQMLDIDAAKRGALVVMALVLKADQARVDSEHEYFHKIRAKLGAEAVTVPVGLEAHKALALKYLVG